jgi:HEPN domain-containing protein
MKPLEELRQWLRIARNDLRVARLAIPNGPLEPGCFHCQQAIEKLLKAWLISRGEHPPFTHDLTLLLDLCEQQQAPFMDHRDEWEWVTGFGVTARYPTEVPEPDVAEAERALQAAESAWTIITLELPPEVQP